MERSGYSLSNSNQKEVLNSMRLTSLEQAEQHEDVKWITKSRQVSSLLRDLQKKKKIECVLREKLEMFVVLLMFSVKPCLRKKGVT